MVEYAPVKRDGKPADALVIHCSDPDFQPAYRSVIDKLVEGKHDLVVRPGASCAVVEDPAALNDISLLQGLHNFPTAIILDHIDCKKFGITERGAEIQKHIQYLKAAGQAIRSALPQLRVDGYLMDWDKFIITPDVLASRRD